MDCVFFIYHTINPGRTLNPVQCKFIDMIHIAPTVHISTLNPSLSIPIRTIQSAPAMKKYK